MNGLPVTMTLSGTQLGEVSFVVATVDLPDANPATLEHVLEAMKVGLLRNLAATPYRDGLAHFLRHDPGAVAPGEEFEASGQLRGTQYLVVSRLCAEGGRALSGVSGQGPNRRGRA